MEWSRVPQVDALTEWLKHSASTNVQVNNISQETANSTKCSNDFFKYVNVTAFRFRRLFWPVSPVKRVLFRGQLNRLWRQVPCVQHSPSEALLWRPGQPGHLHPVGCPLPLRGYPCILKTPCFVILSIYQLFCLYASIQDVATPFIVFDTGCNFEVSCQNVLKKPACIFTFFLTGNDCCPEEFS